MRVSVQAPRGQFNEVPRLDTAQPGLLSARVAKLSITVITPLLNRAAMLPDALASLAAEKDGDFEHIVVDGGSTDGSQQIARASGAQVVEAPGTSIYEAINIGLDRAEGGLICLLNSDDRFSPGALASFRNAFAGSDIELARGGARAEEWQDSAWAPSRDGGGRSAALTLRNVLLHASNINACAFRRALFERVGRFDPAYPISADREWMARALLCGTNTSLIGETVYIYRAHQGSKTIGANKPATLRWVREHLAFSRRLLDRRDVSASDRAALLAFHAKESAHLALLQLGKGKVSGADLAASFNASPLWPLHAIAPVTQIALRRLGRALAS